MTTSSLLSATANSNQDQMGLTHPLSVGVGCHLLPAPSSPAHTLGTSHALLVVGCQQLRTGHIPIVAGSQSLWGLEPTLVLEPAMLWLGHVPGWLELVSTAL